MEIILMRHGEPFMAPVKRVTAAQMKAWVENYDLSTVRAESVPPQKVQIASSAEIIVSSTSLRALSSVVALGREPSFKDSVFREAELPYAKWNLVRLSPNFWAAFFRLLWFFGYSRAAESLALARSRAKVAADQLVSFAASGPVLLVGHGIMNRFIAKELLSLGWCGPNYPKSEYWGCSVYRSRNCYSGRLM